MHFFLFVLLSQCFVEAPFTTGTAARLLGYVCTSLAQLDTKIGANSFFLFLQ